MGFVRDRLHINSEVLQPLQNGLAGPPAGFAGSCDWFHTIDRVALHVEIESGISAGGRWAGVSKPLADSGQVHARLQQGDRGTVAHAVRVQSLPREARDGESSLNSRDPSPDEQETRESDPAEGRRDPGHRPQPFESMQ